MQQDRGEIGEGGGGEGGGGRDEGGEGLQTKEQAPKIKDKNR